MRFRRNLQVPVLRIALVTAMLPAQISAQRSDTIVKIAGRPVHAGVAKLAEELSIGVVDGAEEYIFGEVTELAVAPDGTIYVFDRIAGALRKYDANGRYVRTLGAKGQGPGEYRTGGGLAVMKDGRVLLWDTGNWRINIYSAAGESIGNILTPSGINGTLVTQRSLMVDTADVIYYRRTIIIPRQFENRPELWVRFRPNGTVLDTVRRPAFRFEPRRLSASAGGSSQSAEMPFDPIPVWVPSPLGYFVTGIPDRYAVELHVTGGPPISIRRPDVRPNPVTNRERDESRKRIEDNMRRVEPSWSWTGPAIPRTKPFYVGLKVAEDGRIWVPVIPEMRPPSSAMSMGAGGASIGPAGRGNAPAESPHPALYDVFEPNGTYLGQVEIPARVSMRFMRGERIWGVAYDDNDVAIVKRYSIAWQ
jgi:hypothetical protein